MNISKIAKKRKSVRLFKSSKPSPNRILESIESSLQCPFAGNMNNIKFLIVENKNTISEIAKTSNQLWISEAPTLLIICSNDQHLTELYNEKGKIYARQQAGAVIQTILLELTEQGIATCWIGSYNEEKIKEMLKIPKDIIIEGIIAMGYEDTKSKRLEKPNKKTLESTVFWHKWDNKSSSIFL
jgi:nitroreductase